MSRSHHCCCSGQPERLLLPPRLAEKGLKPQLLVLSESLGAGGFGPEGGAQKGGDDCTNIHKSQEGVQNGRGGDFQSRISWDFTQPWPPLQRRP